MQTGGRLVQNIQRLPGSTPCKLGGKLYPLCLSARKRGGGLPQADIAQPDVIQRLQFVFDLRNTVEENKRFFHRHFQHVRNVLSLEMHLQRVPVIALSVAHVTGDVYVRQKVHFDLFHAVSLACFAPSAPDVEGKSAGFIAFCFGVRGAGKQIPDIGKQTGIGCGIGAWGSADRALVDVDHLVQIFNTGDFPVFSGRPDSVVQLS